MIWGPVPEWQPKPRRRSPSRRSSKSKSSKATAASKRKTVAAKPKVPPEPVIPVGTAPRVRSLQMGEKAWFAATDQGLFISVDQGQKWYGQPIQGESNFSAVNNYEDGTVTLAGTKGAYLSHDGGKTWTAVTLPKYVSGVYNLTVTPGSVLWLGSPRGRDALHRRRPELALHSRMDCPRTMCWRCTMTPPASACWRPRCTPMACLRARMAGQTWQRTPEARVSIRSAMNFQGRLLGASAHNGLLLEQGGVAASESARAAEGSSSANQQ